MAKPKKAFRKRWLLLIPLAALAVIGYFLWGKLKPSLELGSCKPSNQFTVAPTDDNAFDYLVPLGNIGPPDHTIPTDHLYYVFKRANANDPSPIETVRSPGKVHITQINRQTVTKSGSIFTDDYHLFFSPCRGVNVTFDHIHTLAPKLAAAIAHGASCQEQHPRSTDTYRYCNSDTDVLLLPGETIGTAGGTIAAGFDFGASDVRQPALVYANPKRYGSKPDHTSCPIDLFAEPLKSQLMSRFKRTKPPVCGQVDQDKAGTLQGNWYSFKTGAANGPSSWDKSLSLVHDNLDPDVGIVSLGGLNGLVLRMPFTPTSSGLLDREFSQVTPGASVYCYQVDDPGNGQSASGGPVPAQNNHSLLIQLASATELKIQAKDGPCEPAPYSLSSPTSYYR